MQHPTLTLIVRYPNQTLQLASQEHLKSKLIVECQSCHSKDIIDNRTTNYKCKKCNNQNKIKVPDGLNCRKPGCNGSMKIYLMATGLMTYQCDTCGHSELVNRNLTM